VSENNEEKNLRRQFAMFQKPKKAINNTIVASSQKSQFSSHYPLQQKKTMEIGKTFLCFCEKPQCNLS
jgi:hypothetical protein